MAEGSPVEECPKAGIADSAAPDVLVMVNVGAGGRAAVVEVDETESGEAEGGVEPAQGAAHPPGAVETVAGGMGVASVETHTHSGIATQKIEQKREVLPVAAELAAPPGGVFKQQAHSVRRACQQQADPMGHRAQGAVAACAHVMAEMEDDEAPAEEVSSGHVVGDTAEGAVAKLAVGGGEVDEIAGVDDEG